MFAKNEDDITLFVYLTFQDECKSLMIQEKVAGVLQLRIIRQFLALCNFSLFLTGSDPIIAA